MKILKVEFENINSLAGKHSIDFTDPSYQLNHNLFVIAGNTGSGKSSILDAISLALYGKTPRQEKILKTGNEVMTRETSSCYAEVTYECKMGTYISRWSQSRTKKRGEGEGSLKDPEALVVNKFNSEEVPFNGKTNTNQSLAGTTEKLTQLNYNQFCRSIMLAQGEFDKFLKGSPEERTAILEKLNGAERYRKIAAGINEKCKFLRDKNAVDCAEIERLKSSILTEEDEAKKNVELNEKNALAKEMKTAIDSVQELLTWYQQLEEFSKAWNDAVINLEKNKNEIEKFANDEKRLKLAENARKNMEQYRDYKRLSKEHADDISGLEKLKKDYASAQKLQDDKKIAVDTEQSKLETAKKTFESQSEIFKTVRSLDQNIESLEKQQNSAQEKNATHQNAVQKCKEDLENCNKKIADLEKSVSKTNVELSSRAGDEKIETNLPDLKSICDTQIGLQKNLAIQQRDLAEKELVVATIVKTVDGLKRNIEEKSEYLEAHKDDEGLKDVLDQISENALSIVKIDAEAKGFESGIAGISQDISDTKKDLSKIETDILTIEARQKELFSNDVIVLADVIQKHFLKAGECCPVCGSKEHPACDSNHSANASEYDAQTMNNVAEKIKAVQKELETAQSKKNNIRERIFSLSSNLESEKVNKNRCLDKIQKAQNDTNEALRPWNVSVTVENVVETINSLKSRSEKYTNCKNKIAELQGTFNVENTKLEGAQNAANESRLQLESTKNESAEAIAKAESLFSQWIAPFNAEKTSDYYNDLINRSNQYKSLESNLQKQNGDFNQENVKKTGFEKALSNAVEIANISAKELQNLSNELEQQKGKRKDLFDDKNVDNEEDLLQRSIAILEGNLSLLREKHNEATATFTKLSTQKKDCEIRIQNRTKILDDATNTFNQVLITLNLCDTAAFEKAILEDSEYEDLMTSRQNLTEEKIRLTEAEHTTRTSLDNHKNKHSDVDSKEFLEQKLADLTSENKAANETIINLQATLKQNSENKARYNNLKEKNETFLKELRRWEQLKNWVGKKDGSDFATFVQSLTFKTLLEIANKHLAQLRDRYELMPHGALDFKLKDASLTEPRSITNISGGEKFLISLSLALAIAELASKNVRVDTLFLDEGFGTLDQELLQDTLDAIKSHQQKSGKMVGIITHVESVVNSIPQRIEVTEGPDGHSRISGPGVS